MATIAKADLVDGATYSGHCRNADTAKWDASRDTFVITRTKFGSNFSEYIKHIDDEPKRDAFSPEELISK